ncbi:MAG TPA: hypothetical protein VHU84_12225 [Lacipirellulaceae bacterium]|nr:hypothetical protein [Lacipirellulaceae bacterium]
MHHYLVAIFGACLLVANPLFAEPLAADSAARQIDDRQAEANGIRTLTSKHLILCTDVPSSPEVDGLPALFDKAVPQWAEYFGVDLEKTAHWQARAYLIGDRRRFEALKLLPPGREDFVNGISMGAELWFHDQPTAYYRRHLLLHEGTHVFMASFLGGCGPGWYMEGIAELFGTHRLDEKTGKLTMRIMPQNREEVPMLGRIKLIRDAISDLTLPDVMQLDNRKQMNNESYAWCWAAAKLLDTHPRYRDRFRALSKYVLDEDFNDKMRHDYDADWNNLLAEWLAFVTTLDHGYDFDRMAIDFNSHGLLNAGTETMSGIATDHGWQSTGVQLEAGKSYRVTAKGRFQIAVEELAGKSQPWPCEPGGVTIEYHDGHPLGMLLGAINPAGELSPNAPMSFVHPIPIGLEATIKPAASGTLFLRVNDSAAKLADNSGTLSATIVPVVSP